MLVEENNSDNENTPVMQPSVIEYDLDELHFSLCCGCF